jgi:hypothetical protein
MEKKLAFELAELALVVQEGDKRERSDESIRTSVKQFLAGNAHAALAALDGLDAGRRRKEVAALFLFWGRCRNCLVNTASEPHAGGCDWYM